MQEVRSSSLRSSTFPSCPSSEPCSRWLSVSAPGFMRARPGGVAAISVQVTAILSCYVDRLRIWQAGQIAQPSGLPAFLQFRRGLMIEFLRAAFLRPLAGAAKGARRDQPELPRAVLRTVQVPVRRPSAGVADCPAPAGAVLRGPAFRAYLRDDGRLLPGGRDTLSLVAAPGQDCWQLRSSRAFASQPVTNQVTAVPGAGRPASWLSRPGARCRDCSRSVSPGRLNQPAPVRRPSG